MNNRVSWDKWSWFNPSVCLLTAFYATCPIGVMRHIFFLPLWYIFQCDCNSVAADVSVRELFQLLASYGSWVEDRERAINHFASTFPELVQRVDANDEACNISMVISDPKQEWGLNQYNHYKCTDFSVGCATSIHVASCESIHLIFDAGNLEFCMFFSIVEYNSTDTLKLELGTSKHDNVSFFQVFLAHDWFVTSILDCWNH